METFFPEVLERFRGEDFLKRVCARYHYEETQLGGLRAVAEEMLPLMEREAYWEVCAPCEGFRPGEIYASGEEKTHTTEATCPSREIHVPRVCGDDEKDGTVYEGVLMTLGEGLDRLQESYHQKGMLTESYMLEVLAGELLLQAYRAYNLRVRERGNGHVARYHFPGSEEKLPLEMLPAMLSRFSGQVSCNEAFCLLPGKSVVFLAELTRDETVSCEGICAGCTSVRCPNRTEESLPVKHMWPDMPLTYGYRMIFGKW